jgi:hypothetical protein
LEANHVVLPALHARRRIHLHAVARLFNALRSLKDWTCLLGAQRHERRLFFHLSVY